MPSNPDSRLNYRHILTLLGLSILSLGAYLLASHFYYRLGFPLDDSWIHQSYARNLALRGEWAFLPGQPSNGSTAPLWSALLAIGYWLRLAPYVWTYALGVVILWGLAWLAEIAVRHLVPVYAQHLLGRPRFPWAGALVALEWHLVWAGGSGMETLLHTALITLVLVSLISERRNYFGLGVLVGLSIWLRPDGVTLLAPVVVTLILVESSFKRRTQALVSLGLGFGGLFAFYLLFNLILNGSPWPNTFYAKQAEYALLQQIPFWKRLASEAVPPLVGVGIALLPGVLITAVTAVRRRAWGLLAGMAWFLGYIGLYAWRLPVTYQHGRYIIPAMLVFFIWGFAGLARSVLRLSLRSTYLRQHPSMNSGHRLLGSAGWRWMLATSWKMTTVVILLFFWGRGALTYAQDVAVIESEMVKTARWVAVNLPADALVATHDIGAMGYFSEHNLLDLAGLVSPEVVPFIRDESSLRGYLNDRGVAYLVTFPDWYPSLTRDLRPVFRTESPFAPALGEENMAVYRWLNP
ncbi:MAG: hypothetical protein C0393_07635 [Anaerolinea sp.]|nr:hypothetical protein [Anaerolinea sp.]